MKYVPKLVNEYPSLLIPLLYFHFHVLPDAFPRTVFLLAHILMSSIPHPGSQYNFCYYCHFTVHTSSQQLIQQLPGTKHRTTKLTTGLYQGRGGIGLT
jgi:hypothetical protein